MKLFWYYHRLRSMCLGEVFWRVRRLTWQLCARFQHKRWGVQYQRKNKIAKTIPEMIDKINFFGLSDIQAENVPQNCVDATISVAEKLVQHRYSYLALNEIDLGQEINWNRGYKQSIDTPLEFGPWMDYRDTNSYGHFKYFWELGRFQHLITLAKAYYLTGEDKYAHEVSGQIKSFVRQCPYLRGVHWIMPMEVGLRLISLVWIVAFMKEYLKNDIEACNHIEEIVRSHVDYTAKNFSAYSSANNHLIGEVAGVFIASLCFEGLKDMTRYKQKTYDMLCREISLQFYSDGVNREQTTHYHVSCYNCFLLAGLLGRDNGLDFPNEYWETLERAAAFICALVNDSGSIPHIGDSDDGKTILLSELDYNQNQSLLATGAVLFNRRDFKAKAGFFDEMSLWLLGKKGKVAFDALDVDNKAGGPEKFEEGGYYILRSEDPSNPRVIFDCGPLGFGDIAAHGHADSLSFVLYAYGREFFIDPGTYIFEAENPYRNYFRSTAAHNTITVDGMDQSEIAGPFLWDNKATSHIEKWADTEEYTRVAGRHDGYQRLKDPVIHRRTIQLEKKQGIISVDDSIEAKSNHDVCQYFHMAPECNATQTEHNHWKISNKEKTIELIIDDQFQSDLVSGSEDPICGWASKSYDTKVPISTLVARCSTQGNHSFLTKIFL